MPALPPRRPRPRKGPALGAEMYQIIADAEINRDLAVTDKDWAAKKIEAQQDIDGLATMADTDAGKGRYGCRAARRWLISKRAFENDMLPLLARHRA